eukprot:TRINITY_DN18123_c0_g2_i1.p8 TRINITY_DN18123_c0_g2~~TRINITY_DN18123_c0_g2_i1.p8  ORF type:complete len:106 (-),score=6.09 TRINITY_DN18123_c0_g2_i1:1744-2061(-)
MQFWHLLWELWQMQHIMYLEFGCLLQLLQYWHFYRYVECVVTPKLTGVNSVLFLTQTETVKQMEKTSHTVSRTVVLCYLNAFRKLPLLLGEQSLPGYYFISNRDG